MVTRIRMFGIICILLLCGVLYSLVMAYNKGLDTARGECIDKENARILQEVGIRERIRNETAKKTVEEKRQALKKYVIQ